MALPSYYRELYVALCSGAGPGIVGSGFCCDGKRVVTCAHVVNSSLGRKPTELADLTGKKVSLQFSQSSAVDTAAVFIATVTYWGPSASGATQLLLKNDIAVLELDDTELCRTLQSFAEEVVFIADDVRNNEFVCVSHNTQQALDNLFQVNGSIQFYFPSEGKTQLSTSDNVRDAFFKRGCSGSPVFSETLQGISGIVDQLVEDKTAAYAFMIDVRRIAQLIGIPLKKKDKADGTSLRQKFYNNKKYLCDRLEVIDEIMLQKQQAGGRNLFFLWGSNRQEGNTFSNRYRYEFFSSDEPTTSQDFISVRLPEVSNPVMFKSRVWRQLEENLLLLTESRHDVNDTDTIGSIYRRISRLKNKLFIFKINFFGEEQLPCYEWFIHSFLCLENETYPDDLHVLVLYEYKETDAQAEKLKDRLSELFAKLSPLFLKNVNRGEVTDWIEMIERDDESPFKQILLDTFAQKEEYAMKEVLTKFEEARKNVPNNNQF